MKNYQKFILENTQNKQSKYINTIISYLNKNTNYTYAEYDEHFSVIKKDDNKKYDSILYLMVNLEDNSETKAIRFNFDGLKLQSIDMWENFEFDLDNGPIYNKPSYEMTVPNSVLEVLDDIVAFVEGEFTLNENINLDDIEKSPEENVKSDINKFDNLDLDLFEIVKANVIQIAFNENARAMIVSGVGGLGKCLGKGTKIIMYDGTLKNVEDILPGEKLMGPDSKPRNVLSINSGVSKMYKIKQKKGIDYIVNDEHILSLKKSKDAKTNGRFKEYDEIVNIPIKEYLEKSKNWKRNFYGWKVAIDFNHKNIEIDPYYLGLWLGDGTGIETSITNIDEEVIDFLHEYANKLGLICNKYEYGNKTPKYKILSEGINQPNPLLKKIKKLNLYNNKYIPNNYLFNDKNVRLELLAGLIDSDGYLTKPNGYEITMKSKELIQQIKYLADSLGFKTSMRKRKGKIKNSFEGDYYRVSINGNVEIIPIKIERKKIKEIKRRVDHTITGIKIEELNDDNYFGFEIDGDHLFLLEDCTVTHNTYDVRATLNQFNKKYQYYKGNTTSAGLYELLFRYRKELIVLDDMDDALIDKSSRDILKAVLDTGEERVVSRKVKGYYYPDDKTDEEIDDIYIKTGKLPNQFSFVGKVIFITNLKEEEIDPVIFTRVVSIDVDLTQKQIIQRIKKIMPSMLPKIPMDMKEETLELMIGLLDTYVEKAPLNLRSFYHCINFRVSNDFDVNGEKLWKILVKNFLVRKTKLSDIVDENENS